MGLGVGVILESGDGVGNWGINGTIWAGRLASHISQLWRCSRPVVWRTIAPTAFFFFSSP